ncbi:MAG: alpha/beta hydrolase [Myxococcota bacterium]
MLPEQEIRRRRLELPERGVGLALVDWGGDGPLALFSHANGFCADTLGLLAERLRPRFRVIGYDSRGHGDSDKPAPPGPYAWEEFARDTIAVAEALVRELSVPRIALGLGHSFGGTCMMTAAARRPALFERIALLDPVILPREGDFTGWRPVEPHPSAAIARKRAHVFASRDAAREKWRAKGTFGDWDPRALELYLRHAFADLPDGRIDLKCPGEIEASVYEQGGSFDPWGEIAKLRAPGLLLHAGRGNFPLPFMEKFCAEADRVECRSLDAGHLLPMVAPELVADELLAWLDARS